MSEAEEDSPHKLTTSAIAFIGLYKTEMATFHSQFNEGLKELCSGEPVTVGSYQRSGNHCLL